jgi:uncharacterized LabA/DUF88 family protein
VRTHVYIDGFNFYYGAVRGTPYKWLDFSKLCGLLLPNNQILSLKYFTALVSARPGDLDQPIRQQTYLRALRTLRGFEVHFGHFLSHPCRMPLANPQPGGPRTVEVIKTEEKGSDVNLAAHLLHDAHRGRFDVAVLITNDSDLVEPMKLVRYDLGLKVGVLNPHKRKPAHEIAKYATFIKQIRTGVLANSQLPITLTDAQGTIHKPSGW